MRKILEHRIGVSNLFEALTSPTLEMLCIHTSDGSGSSCCRNYYQKYKIDKPYDAVSIIGLFSFQKPLINTQ